MLEKTKSLVKVELSGELIFKGKLSIAWPAGREPHPFDIKSDSTKLVLNGIEIHCDLVTRVLQKSLFMYTIKRHGSMLRLRCPTPVNLPFRVSQDGGDEVIEIYHQNAFRPLETVSFLDLVTRDQKREIARMAAVSWALANKGGLAFKESEIDVEVDVVVSDALAFFPSRGPSSNAGVQRIAEEHSLRSRLL